MNKTKKRMAIAAIAATGCLAGIYGFQTSENESKSALTIANIEALSRSETNTDCDTYCREDPNYMCVLNYSWGVTYCVRKSQRY